MLHSQIPWFIGGPVMGLCVVALRLLMNARLGVTGGFSAVIERVFDWRAFFLLGLIVGAALFVLLAGTQTFEGYGWLTQTFTGSERWLVAPILFACGIAIGFGAKTAGGCTSGNGLSGVSMTSPASLAATATFFATAIVVTFVIKAVI
jgi:uncharacterized membrane protein YedE/YeeE